MVQTEKPTRQRICLTPTRNEAWIIDHFLVAAHSWADHVIVADQGSTDETRRKIVDHLKTDLVINDSPVFDEVHRQRLLIGRARELAEDRILIALDADEALSANVSESREWNELHRLPAGTVLRFQWVNILPGFKQAWIPKQLKRCGFVDDGSQHGGRRIHNQRVPGGPDAPVVDLKEVVVLHFQYVLWERMRRKHNWYQVWELVENRQKRPLDIFRKYHHMFGSWDPDELHPVKPEWLAGYEKAGLDFRSLKCESVTWWDREVVRMLSEHGASRFRKLAIWDQDWNDMAAQIGSEFSDFSDPRSVTEKVIHRILKVTQKRRELLVVRVFERLLRNLGW
jgi:hypothetical protein